MQNEMPIELQDNNAGAPSLNPVQPMPNAGGPMPAPDQSGVTPGPEGVQNLPAAMPPPDVQKPFVDRLHANVEAVSKLTPPEAASAPGSWARSLIGGLLKSLPTAVRGIETSLGDAAVASEGAREGEGNLSAVGRIANATRARQQQEQKFQTENDRERALTAKTNVDTHYQEMLLHSLQGKISDQANTESLANGLSAVNMATSGPAAYGLPAARTIAADISEKELQQAIANQTFDPTSMTFWHTKTVDSYDPATGKPRLDADGNPVHEKRYTIITNPQEIVLDKNHADFLNTNLGTNYQEGQRFPGALGLAQFQQASNAHAMRAKIDSDRKDAELADLTRDQKLASLQAEKNLGPDFFHVLSQSGSLDNLMKFVTGEHKDETGGIDPRSAEFASNHPGAGQDLVNLYGGLKSYQEQRDKENKEAKDARNARDPLAKLETDPAEMTGDKSVAAKALLQNMLTNPETPVQDIPRVQRLIRQADVAESNYQHFKQTEEETKEKIADGSPDDAAELLVSGSVSPQQLISSRKPAFATKAFTKAQVLQPGWSAAKADADFSYARNPGTMNSLNMISSMTNPGGSIDILKGTIDKFPKVPVQIANQVFNPTATQFGSQDVTDFHVAMLGLADEFSKIMGAQIGSDTSRQQALDILKDSYSKSQLNSGVDILKRLVQARGKTMVGNNPTLKLMYPNIAGFELITPQSTGTPTAPNGATAAPKTSVPAVPTGAIGQGKGSDGKMYYVDINHKPLAIVPGQ